MAAKYLIWNRANGVDSDLWRATLSYLIRYRMRACFTTSKPIPRFNMGEKRNENQVLDLEWS